ncbi:putative beta-1,4-xylosyltransferase IRX9 [Iris pallida]|uniref:Glycosyltransferases n=1 Tax=Iris pallida TaxID=29817 RepID=A0AAX6ISY0_IRIPA|nr:putative beta-1,4-xylosyltransferase IRX9 [Iris pallida]KAJ6854334.1 putative beta-1,4-xylosyltransferase IRX9 [Iris pallida]
MREMGSFDRSKKRIQLWKKAALHFSLCFVMGFFTGFAPTSTASLFSGQANPYLSATNLGISAKPTEALHLHKSVDVPGSSLNRSLLMSKIPSDVIATNASGTPRIQEPLPLAVDDDDSEESNRELLIIVTTTKSGDRFQGPLLRRLANTLKLVSSPLLWVVVEARSDAPRTAETLRRTGIMYRHLTYAENFTDAGAEADHQRNVALNHVEFHRLNGIVHFADVFNVYDLEFFEEIREIDVFGAWPVVMASANRKRVAVEGPVCNSFKVVGWQSKDLNDKTKDATTTPNDGVTHTNNPKPSKINISGFAFNSSILWDPERWGRPTSVPDTSQDSMKFVQEVVLQDETKLRAIPPDCSKIMLWHLHIPSDLPLPSSQIQNRR